jgi:transposase
VLIVNEIGDTCRFPSPATLCGYAGLVPAVYASGSKVFHGRLTEQGNKWLRWALVDAVRPAVKTYRELRAYYERLRYRRGLSAGADLSA